MNMTVSRAEVIREQFEHHFGVELDRVAISVPEPVAWRSFPADMPNGDPRYGWLYPYEHEGAGDTEGCVFVACYCPEIIDEQTAHLSDDQLVDYLEAIKYLCDLHIGYLLETPDFDARVQRAKDELYEVAPGSLDLLHDVQLHAVVHGLA